MRAVSEAVQDRNYGEPHLQSRGMEASRRVVEGELIRNLPLYRRMAAQRLRSFVEAEEVAQSFALRALERAEQLREPLAVRGWLRRIFETTLIDHCRRSSGRRSREIRFEAQLHDRADEPGGPPEIVADLAGVVARLLPRLKPEYAEIIREIDLMERSHAEAAGTLGITVNNLTVRLHRARGALRSQLRAERACTATFA